jgi:hypothetical protein
MCHVSWANSSSRSGDEASQGAGKDVLEAASGRCRKGVDDVDYEVDSIAGNVWDDKGTCWYQVRFKGYGSESDLMLLESDFDAPDLLSSFKKGRYYNRAPQPPSKKRKVSCLKIAGESERAGPIVNSGKEEKD